MGTARAEKAASPARTLAVRPEVAAELGAVASFRPEEAELRPSPAACACGGGCPRCKEGGGSPRLQAKLAVSHPADYWEREADRAADQALRGGTIGRLTPVSGTAQRRSSAAGPQAGGMDAAEAAVAGGGRPLSAAERSFFEPRFGRDFSDVRVHDDARAHAAAAGVKARAYALGTRIALGAGQYAPSTSDGRRLLAHELAHVVQQGQGTGTIRRVIQRRWDQPTNECDAEPTGRAIDRIVIDQQTPQTITLHWSDSSTETFQTSTGKGHCCVDPAETDVVGCSGPESRRSGSNCTPLTEGAGHTVVNRFLERNGWKFWTDIVPARGIGMHQYPVRDGTPLSHGCVRLEESTARRIFCGVRRNRTQVQIVNFARPLCNHPQLIAEWKADLASAALATDGEPPDSSTRETRRTLREAFRVDEAGLAPILATPQADVAARIPRCSYLAPDVESARLAPQSGQARSEGDRLSRGAGFAARAARLTTALEAARTLAAAETAVETHGRRLWNAATQRAQGGGNTDDRALYWARLQLVEAIGQVRLRFLTTPDERRELVAAFDRASRGMTSVTFPARSSDKKILISGFDPFGLTGDRRRGNPSGAAALALDGVRLRSGRVRGRVQAVIFPVRFRDFDQGLVESLFRPFLSGPSAVDMIMTISQGGGADFEVEQFAGRRRSSGGFADNLGRTAGGTREAPVTPPGLAAGPEFLETALPAEAIRGALGRTAPLTGETEVAEIPAGGTGSELRAGGPTGGAGGFTGTAAAGSGGGFLSNEIFYRTLLLRRDEGATIPVGHLHTPLLASPSGTGLSDRAFVRARDGMVRTIRRILEAALPTL